MKNHSSLLGILFLTLSVGVHAQYAEKMGFPLKVFLKQDHAPGTMVDLFVRGPRHEAAAAVLLHGGRVKMSREGVVSARVPVERITALALEPAVQFFEFSLDKGMVMNDSMRVKSRINEIHSGQAPLIQGYTGAGVIMGLIDSGMDHRHPDMQLPDGRTRILKYWDQTLPVHPERTPEPYGYGQVWDSTHINTGQMTSVDQPGYNGHGTSVSSIAAGNGSANGRHKGAAPDADYIVVSSKFNAPNWRSVVADGVKYIFDEAEAMGRPAVINASLGTYFGSHDALDAAALFIDDLLLEQGGRAMVCAGGNSNEFAPYHLRTTVDADTSWTWFRRNPNSAFGYPVVYFELWADVDQFDQVSFAIGADRPTPLRFRGRTPFHTIQDVLGTVVTDTLRSFSGNRLGIVEMYAIQRGDQYQLQVHMATPDSVSYRYRFMSTGEGMFDIWSSSSLGTSAMDAVPPDVALLPEAVHYVLPDRDQHIVDSWACSPHVVTVANYQNETDYIDYFGNPQFVPGAEDSIASPSSAGPARTGLMKPDIASPGNIIFSAPPIDLLQNLIASSNIGVGEGGWHIRGGGTSAASPSVAGIIALYFQKCPTASAAEVMQALLATAVVDQYTGSVPNNRWGAGKIDGFAALITSTPAVDLEVVGDEPFCQGDELLITGPEGMSGYLWNTGATSPGIGLDSTAQVSLQVINASGCIGLSDTLQFEVLPVPPVPTVEADATVLTSSEALAYQWYRNGELIPGAVDQVFEATTGGTYSVVVSNEFGCTAASDPVPVIITGIGTVDGASFGLWPSPAHDHLMIDLPDEGAMHLVEVIDGLGAQVATHTLSGGRVHRISTEMLASGAYVVRAVTPSLTRAARFMKR